MGMIGNYKVATIEEFKKIYNKEISKEDFLNNNNDYLDIDKTWHILKYILTGSSWEFSFEDYDYIVPINEKTLILNNIDMGFGSAMFIPSENVKKAYSYMCNVTKEQFKEKFSINDMLEDNVYPVQKNEDETELFEYVYPYFEKVKKLFRKASMEDKYIIFWLS